MQHLWAAALFTMHSIAIGLFVTVISVGKLSEAGDTCTVLVWSELQAR